MPNYLKNKYPTTILDEKEISAFKTHDDFNIIGIEILKEIAILFTTVTGCIRVDSTGNEIPFNHEEAAIIGNMVRFCKLTSAFLEQFAKGRGETASIMFRCLAETYINLKFFLKFKDEHTLNHYIKHSLRQELNLLEIIKRNVADKEKMDDIEERMIASIKRSFRHSDFEEDKVNNSSKWDSKVKSRVKEIIGPDFYVLIYGLASHSIHGNWQDLISFHLKRKDEGFLPEFNWTLPTLQIVTAVTTMSCNLLKNYAEVALPKDEKREELFNVIDDILLRALQLDSLHEAAIQRS